MHFQTYTVVNPAGRPMYHPEPNVNSIRAELLDLSRVKGFSLMVDVGDFAYQVVDIDGATREPICRGDDGAPFTPL